jgi:transcriptional regulator with XRE-family HTH domain
MRLGELRKKLGLTQKQLGERAGISQRQISAIERGDRDASMANWRALARELGVHVAYLTGDVRPVDPDLVGASAVLADDQALPGLKELAMDGKLVESLEISKEEWGFLHSLRPPGALTKSGYVSLLFALRAGLK